VPHRQITFKFNNTEKKIKKKKKKKLGYNIMDNENKFGKKFGELLLILCCVVFMRIGDVLF
jgi:hypothetical protein